MSNHSFKCAVAGCALRKEDDWTTCPHHLKWGEAEKSALDVVTEQRDELLVALEECYQWAESQGWHEPGRRKCEAAIAKAKGEA